MPRAFALSRMRATLRSSRGRSSRSDGVGSVSIEFGSAISVSMRLLPPFAAAIRVEPPSDQTVVYCACHVNNQSKILKHESICGGRGGKARPAAFDAGSVAPGGPDLPRRGVRILRPVDDRLYRARSCGQWTIHGATGGLLRNGWRGFFRLLHLRGHVAGRDRL